MKKFILFSFFLFSFVPIYSQNYLINFGGTGSSTTVDSIFVENLKQGTKLSMKGSDVLNLTSTTGIGIPELGNGIAVIYPNPAVGRAELIFTVNEKGNVIVSICDLAGRIISQSNKILQPGRHRYFISGLARGIFVINVSGQNLHHSLKLVSENIMNSKGTLDYASIVGNENKALRIDKPLKSSGSTIPMKYNDGERLKITGKSGIYNTVITEIPTQNMTITFYYTPCPYTNNINYPTVRIGTQIWMAENLKNSKYSDGNAIPNITDSLGWTVLTTGAYCWYNNDAGNKDTYGALYNWYALNTGKLCPSGWHVPSDAEWNTLITFLGGEIVAGKKLKETGTAHWAGPYITGFLGTNESGFTALPGGNRFKNSKFNPSCAKSSLDKFFLVKNGAKTRVFGLR